MRAESLISGREAFLQTYLLALKVLNFVELLILLPFSGEYYRAYFLWQYLCGALAKKQCVES